jgi:hypothetical protein
LARANTSKVKGSSERKKNGASNAIVFFVSMVILKVISFFLKKTRKSRVIKHSFYME